MSNLNQNTVDLQAILDAVNALPESTDLTPIVDALAEKGQTVPDGATVDVLASLIAAIEAGGGGEPIEGSFTLAEDVTVTPSGYTMTPSGTTPTWTHGLGFIPKVIMYVNGEGLTYANGGYMGMLAKKNDGNYFACATGASSSTGAANSRAIATGNYSAKNLDGLLTETTSPFMVHWGSHDAIFRAGYSVKWLAYK